MGGEDQIADVLGVEGHLHLEGVLHRPHRGQGVDRGADAADALGEGGSIPGVAALEDDLDAAPHLARRPGVGDFAPINFTFYAEMPFDPGYGVDDNSFGHIHILLDARLGVLSLGQHREFFDEIEVGHEFDGHDPQGDHNFRDGRKIVPAGPGVKADEKDVEPIEGACQEQGAGAEKKEAEVAPERGADRDQDGHQVKEILQDEHEAQEAAGEDRGAPEQEVGKTEHQVNSRPPRP